MTDDQAIDDLLDVLRMLERIYLREMIACMPKAAMTRASLDLTLQLLARRRPTTPLAIGQFLEAIDVAHRLDPAFECEAEPGCCADLLKTALQAIELLQRRRRSEARSLLQASGFSTP